MPKIIYLDQFIWIDIARALNGDPKHNLDTNAAKLILEKVEVGDWILPVSMIHFFETNKRQNDRSRKNVAKIMNKISKGYTIIPFLNCEYFEFKNLNRLLNNEVPIDLKNTVIRKDPLAALGTSIDSISFTESQEEAENIKKFENIVKKELKAHTFIIEELLYNKDSQSYNDIDEKNRRYHQRIKDWLHQTPEKDQYIGLLFPMFKEALEFVCKLYDEEELFESITHGITNIFGEGKEKILLLLEAVPTIYTRVKLFIQISKDLDRPNDINDSKDLAAVTPATIYCDSVFTEKEWCHHIKTTKLNEKFNTSVFSKLRDILQLA